MHLSHVTRTVRWRKRSGFTLVEITVVLAIAALVSAITLGGFKSLNQGHKRTTCQTNLIQIYQACRLYAADETGDFPYHNEAGSTGNKGIGLWALYTFPATHPTPLPTDPDTIAPVGTAPVERYIRNSKILHCPEDFDTDTGVAVNDNHEQLYTDNTKTLFNKNYLSYQTIDPGLTAAGFSTEDAATYQSLRTSDPSDNDWKRQLLHYSHTPAGAAYDAAPNRLDVQVRPPFSNTIVTWCPWHRASGRPYDNALFYDGTVRFVPTIQTPVATPVPTPVQGWRRVPAG